MKNGKRPTRKQKITMQGAKLNTDNWLVTKSTSRQIHVVHRVSGKQRIIST
ncbi:DUF6906 family protein [Paenibacillus radicis (ex Xue et al. 2023)]|uniref:DUF6906 family protein n=1 Tax=Paenibacillus radicis (ex Xue et al. 2023) TaxID=2972489 RepID=UPI003AF32DC1